GYRKFAKTEGFGRFAQEARVTIMPHIPHRRNFLKTAGLAGISVWAAPLAAWADAPTGLVTGQPQAAKVGAGVLADGGNAVDAVVAAALTAGVVALPSCGI